MSCKLAGAPPIRRPASWRASICQSGKSRKDDMRLHGEAAQGRRHNALACLKVSPERRRPNTPFVQRRRTLQRYHMVLKSLDLMIGVGLRGTTGWKLGGLESTIGVGLQPGEDAPSGASSADTFTDANRRILNPIAMEGQLGKIPVFWRHWARGIRARAGGKLWRLVTPWHSFEP